MVAHTTPDCLPYFEGSDSPCVNTGTLCEPSTVWCDLAELLDARFTEWDDTLNRTVVTIPFAQVKRTTPVLVSLAAFDSFTLTWEEQSEDSDNMVNLTADPQLVFIRRPGIWIIHLTAVVSSSVAGTTLTCQVDTSTGSVAASGLSTWVATVPGAPANFEGMSIMFDEPFLVTEADLSGVSAISLLARITNNTALDLTLYEATMSVYWFAEVPA